MSTAPLLADPEQGRVDDLIDTDRYPPLDDLCSWESLANSTREVVAERGAVKLPGFLRPTAVAAIADHLQSAAEHVPIRRYRSSVYGRAELECQHRPDDPRASTLEWLVGHVTRDMFPPYTPAHRLYVAPTFKWFIARCVGEGRIFEYADPLAGLVATVLPTAGQYPWHYDTNEFVATIAIQKPESGGRFEYYQDLRKPGDENLEGLRCVVDGTGSTTPTVLTAEPGDLQLFRGRYSLHQITPVEGPTSRLTLVLSYATRPGVIGPLDRTRSVYGRVTEAHLLASERRATADDGLIL